MIRPEQSLSEDMREKRRNGVIWLVIGLILAVTLGAAYRTDQRADHGDQHVVAQGQQIQSLQGQVQTNGKIAADAKAAAEEANRRLVAAGEPTVPVPTVAPVSPSSSPVSVGLTTEQVRLIVVQELAAQRIGLTQAEVTQIARAAAALVPKPKDGTTPTAAQLQAIAAAAVNVYCADGRCVGKPGEQGKPGDTVTGAPGKDAPPVTDEQLAARVAAYCASDSQPCKGDTGSPGVAGTPGADGRGIAAGPTCLGEGDDSYWLTRYSDGTEQRQDGPCRLQPLLPTTPPSN